MIFSFAFAPDIRVNWREEGSASVHGLVDMRHIEYVGACDCLRENFSAADDHDVFVRVRGERGINGVVAEDSPGKRVIILSRDDNVRAIGERAIFFRK